MDAVADDRARVGARDDDLAGRASAALTAYLDGDAGSLETLVRDVTPLLWHVVRGQGVDAEEAQDVVQGVWVQLVRKATTIRDPQAVLQWLLVSARRAAWRTVRGSRRLAELDGDVHAEGSARARGAPIPGVSVDPSETVIRAERDRVLWDAVGSLDERCQRLLRLVAFVDRPDYASVSVALGMPVGSIGPTRGRCLAKLRVRLESDGGVRS